MSLGPEKSTEELSREIERLRKRLTELEAAHKGQERLQDSTSEKEDPLGVFAPSEWYRSLVETSFDGIFIQKGPKIVYANRRLHEMLGYEPGELIGRDHWVVYAPEFQALTRARGEARMRGENPPSNYEVLLQRKDGSSFEGEILARRIQFEDGPGIHVWIRDLTERKTMEKKREELEQRLQQSRRLEALGTLAGGIAHNFNNLLMAIQGNVSLLLIEMDPEDPRCERLKAIEEAVRSGAGLSRQILRSARTEKVEAGLLDVNGLVREVCSLFGATHKQVRIQQQLAHPIHPVRADQNLLEEVLINLLVNGVQAMSQGGELLVQTENVSLGQDETAHQGVPPGEFVRITVKDTGVGMDQATLQRIFEPFFTTREVGQGTGLGLSTAYGIVRTHGGFMTAESELGEGSTFRVYLPASKDRSAAENSGSGECRGKGTILLVDDEETILKVGTQLLEALGYRVIQAQSGKEALELYEKHREQVNLVMLDMIMPQMGGSQVLRALKEMDPQVRVLLCSGHFPEGGNQAALSGACQGTIRKPFSLEELGQTLQRLMDAPMDSLEDRPIPRTSPRAL
jgi:two-component system cell cycle sensor histidine kinase/response regulator CckA